MSDTQQPEQDGLDRRIRDAWSSGPTSMAPANLREDVMRDIRARLPSESTAFERAVRKGAIAAGLLALAAGTVAFLSGVGHEGPAYSELYALLESQPEVLVSWLLVL